MSLNFEPMEPAAPPVTWRCTHTDCLFETYGPQAAVEEYALEHLDHHENPIATEPELE